MPPVGKAEFWQSESWLPANKFGQRLLHVKVIPISKIGTDPAQAEDMAKRKVWVPADLEISTNDFGGALGELVEKTVNRWFDSPDPTGSGAEAR